MIPRIHVTHPGEHVFGTGNEFVNVHQDVLRHRNQDSPVVTTKESKDVFVGVAETGLWDGEEGMEKEDEGWLGRERWKWWKIYGMHFLFMWNSRGFEYVSVSSFPRYFVFYMKASTNLDFRSFLLRWHSRRVLLQRRSGKLSNREHSSIITY